MARLTTKGRVERHAFVGMNERCEQCGSKRAFFVHNAPNTGVAGEWRQQNNEGNDR